MSHPVKWVRKSPGVAVTAAPEWRDNDVNKCPHKELSPYQQNQHYCSWGTVHHSAFTLSAPVNWFTGDGVRRTIESIFAEPNQTDYSTTKIDIPLTVETLNMVKETFHCCCTESRSRKKSFLIHWNDTSLPSLLIRPKRPKKFSSCSSTLGSWPPRTTRLGTFFHCPEQKTCTVLAGSNCVEHDSTSYAVLKCVEVEFWCGISRCDTGTQCWVHRVNVKAAHFGARVLKRKPPGEGAMPNWIEIWLFQGVNVNEMGWNFHGRILTPWPTISIGIHSLGHLVPYVSTQKPHVWVERLLYSVKLQKESDRVTCKQNSSKMVGKSRSGLPRLVLLRPIRSAKLRSADCLLSLLLMTAIWTAFSQYFWRSRSRSRGRKQRDHSRH